MPVIGRLDEQVDTILIKPLARKDEPAGNIRANQEYENIAQPQTATETAGETDFSDETKAARDELPVWLL